MGNVRCRKEIYSGIKSLTMNTETTPDSPPRVADMLQSAQAEIEQFRDALGKDQASVHDRYEQLKKELRHAIGQMKDVVKENKSLANDVADALRERLARLEEYVPPKVPGLPEADLEKQLTRIREGLDDIVSYLSGLRYYDISLAGLMDRVHRYRIKFAILRLRLRLGALEIKDTFLDLRYDARKKIHTLRQRADRAEEDLEKRWKVFRTELTAAYDHMHKAFTSK